MTRFGVYVHVPFCVTRCGYCDFNTYTAEELPGASRGSFAASAIAELELAAAGAGARAVDTVFFGGGTPTLLPPADLGRVLDAVRSRYGEPSEVTVEANPETVSPEVFEALLAAGVTRVSIGMQSAAPHVLAVLERRHAPGRAVEAAREARAEGFAHVSLDLIYGTPGERDEDFRASLEAALSAGVDHVSAYALIVEPGTRLAAQVRRGEVPVPDDDAMAARYQLADELLGAAGFAWYELSNWALSPDARCAHNVGYWEGGDWLGIGPGAHAHLGGVRSWNVKHPSAWAGRVAAGELPVAGSEVLTAAQRRTERILLESRLASGLPASVLTPEGLASVDALVARGLVERRGDRLLLTLRGRLLADTVALELDR